MVECPGGFLASRTLFSYSSQVSRSLRSDRDTVLFPPGGELGEAAENVIGLIGEWGQFGRSIKDGDHSRRAAGLQVEDVIAAECDFGRGEVPFAGDVQQAAGI